MSDAQSLLRSFLSRSGIPASQAVPAWEQKLLALWESSRSVWPGVELRAEDFVHHVAERWANEKPADVAAFFDSLSGSDLYLACACARGIGAALGAFDRAILSHVPAFVARINPAPSFADEVCQILRTRLLIAEGDAPPRIAGYAGTGSLLSWIRVAAVRTALNLRRNRDDLPRESLDETTFEQMAQEPEAEVLRAQHQREFQVALREAFMQLSPADRNLLRMHFAGGLTGERIAELLQVNRSTVVRGLARIRTAMFHEIRRLLGARLRIPPAELDSFIRIMRSRLNLSLTSLLKEDV